MHTPITRRQALRRQAVLTAASIAAPALSLAQTRNLTLVCAYPPGGGADLMARLIAPHLSRALSQTVVIDNKPGATGQIAAAFVAKAAPDGNTLLMDASAFIINPLLTPKLPYDVDKDFTVLSVLSLNPNVLVCHPSFEAKDVKDLIRLAKANPGKYAYASSGAGSSQHLAGALFESRTGTQLTHIPYRGGGPAFNDVIGGQVPLFFANLSPALAHIQGGRLRPLAVTSKLRTRALPDVPSMEQTGVSNYEVLEWNPVLGPAGMATDVQQRIRKALRTVMDEPEVLGRIRGLSAEVFQESASLTSAGFVKAQQAQWSKVIKERGITAG